MGVQYKEFVFTTVISQDSGPDVDQVSNPIFRLLDSGHNFTLIVRSIMSSELGKRSEMRMNELTNDRILC